MKTMNKYEISSRVLPDTRVTDTSNWVTKLLRNNVPSTKVVEAKSMQECILSALQVRDPTATEKQIIEEQTAPSEFKHENLRDRKWVAIVDYKSMTGNAIIAELSYTDLGWVRSIPQYVFTPKDVIEVTLVEEVILVPVSPTSEEGIKKMMELVSSCEKNKDIRQSFLYNLGKIQHLLVYPDYSEYQVRLNRLEYFAKQSPELISKLEESMSFSFSNWMSEMKDKSMF